MLPPITPKYPLKIYKRKLILKNKVENPFLFRDHDHFVTIPLPSHFITIVLESFSFINFLVVRAY